MFNMPMTKSEAKDFILTELGKIQRPGMDKVIDYLNKSDFFTAPASTRFHSNFEGGLCIHSANVCKVFRTKVKTYHLDVPDESAVIAGTLHDVCKINIYKLGSRNIKVNGNWKSIPDYKTEDPMPLGHGAKSVIILQDMMHLTDIEKFLIRWHMGPFANEKDNDYGFDNAMRLYPAIDAMYCADMEASNIFETSIDYTKEAEGKDS